MPQLLSSKLRYPIDGLVMEWGTVGAQEDAGTVTAGGDGNGTRLRRRLPVVVQEPRAHRTVHNGICS